MGQWSNSEVLRLTKWLCTKSLVIQEQYNQFNVSNVDGSPIMVMTTDYITKSIERKLYVQMNAQGIYRQAYVRDKDWITEAGHIEAATVTANFPV